MEEIRVWYTIGTRYNTYLTAEGAKFNNHSGEDVWKNKRTFHDGKLVKIEKTLVQTEKEKI